MTLTAVTPDRPHLVVLCPDQATKHSIDAIISAPDVIVLVGTAPKPEHRRWPDTGITLTHRPDGLFNVQQWRGPFGDLTWPAVIALPDLRRISRKRDM